MERTNTLDRASYSSVLESMDGLRSSNTHGLLLDAAASLFQGHYPGFPIVPGVLLVEFSALEASKTIGSNWHWVGVRSCRFQAPVRPNQLVTAKVTHAVTEHDDARTSVKVELSVEDARVCTTTLVFDRKASDNKLEGPGLRHESHDTDQSEGNLEKVSSALDLKELLPHRSPILLVDRIRSIVPGHKIHVVKCFSSNEPLMASLSTSSSIPWSLIIESWCQAAGLLLGYSSPNPDVLQGNVMLFGGIRNVAFGTAPTPGCVLEHFATVERFANGTAVLTGETEVDGELVMTVGSITLAQRPAVSLTTDNQETRNERERQ